MRRGKRPPMMVVVIAVGIILMVAGRYVAGVVSEARERGVSVREVLRGGNTGMVFHGRVLDETGGAVVAAEVRYSVVKAGTLSRIMGSPMGGRVKTDAEGRFRISGVSGIALRIDAVSKAGYREMPRKVRRYEYGKHGARPGGHVPGAEEPMIFALAKGPLPKVEKAEVRLAFDWDGEPVRVPVEGMPLAFVVAGTRGGTGEVGTKFDWSFTIGLEKGAVRMAEVGGAALAADAGYGEVVTLRETAADPLWTSGGTMWVDFQTGDGKYGRAKVRVYANRMTGQMEVTWNPEGGRMVE